MSGAFPSFRNERLPASWGSPRAAERVLLLSSTALVAATALAAPALAQNCQVNGNNCYLLSTGENGAAAPANGGRGGDGQTDTGWTWEFDNLNYVESGGSSPLNVSTTGGNGAQGSDGHTGGAPGGNGGDGGDGGAIIVTAGPGTSGTMNGPASGMTLSTTGGIGGGGAYGEPDYLAGTSGTGGDGGTITATIQGTWPIPQGNATGRAIDIWSLGGAGGQGREWTTGQDSDAPNGGTGGNGQEVDVTLGGTFQSWRDGVRIQSNGGAGGEGGDDKGAGQGGDGGRGGNGGAVVVTVDAGASIEQRTSQDAGLWLVSSGGIGGEGGPGTDGGHGGQGGNGNDLTLTLNGGQIIATGVTGSPGILAQSIGGGGGGGGSASHFVIGPQGGPGGIGGSPGDVTITGGNANIRSGNQSVTDPTAANMAPAVLAQSIGGGGGGGGESGGWFAVGGSGGAAVSGQTASISLSNSIVTAYSNNSDGIVAQSIGGGGGKGADVLGTGVGLNMVIGGTAGAGGDGGLALVNSGDGNAIYTTGAHSHGVVAQSIGGGGGMGGAAYSKAVSAVFGASMSVGGSGGAGGGGGQVQLMTDESGAQLATNSGGIRTFGSDSHGILLQSIGGGGGIGGASTAAAKVYGGDDVPSIALTMALGGSGGAGGGADTVTGLNTGLIQTAGAGAAGMMGQSIGGGGGTGGDASSTATASGLNSDTQPEYAITASFAFGGKGGIAGRGGTSDITNSGFILTTGESGDGMLSQSIGGGGGSGGAGDAKASPSGANTITLVAGFGGKGDNGGDGHLAQATNRGTIITLGDGALGVAAQSIGGGGGRGGGAAASTSGTYTATLTLGGSGATAGSSEQLDANGYQVPVAVVENAAHATIVTYGADANGLVAQSIGGGGGSGGKGGTSLATKTSSGDGGTGDSTTVQNVITGIQTNVSTNGMSWLDQYGSVGGAVNLVNQVIGNDGIAVGDDDDPTEALDDATQEKGETDDDNDSQSIALVLGIGGSAGSGGNAGFVTATNAGDIATMGHHADAILAQSIGGGGGKGGSASTAASNDYNGLLAVGGSGGLGGYSGTVQVTNSGTLHTTGALAAGIVAQSVSGGGGVGGASGSSVTSNSKNNGDDDADDGLFRSLAVSLGGDGGGSYSSGQAMVESSGAIVTLAHDATGIVAQSIAGGGGILKTLATDLEGAGGSASATGTEHTLAFHFGGEKGNGVGSGYGSGYVGVTTETGGSIETHGDNSYGILAQSISGGGGVALGGKLWGNTVGDFFGSGTTTGSVIDDGKNDQNDWPANSGLYVNVGDAITTHGAGGIGVVAQSIGGGGGLAGDTGSSGATYYEAFSGGSTGQFSGNGGFVGVTLEAGGSITTKGTNAPGIFAQSIGGGGGRVTTDSASYVGTAGGAGQGHEVVVTVQGSITTLNQGSAGVIAQSDGDASSESPVTVTIADTGSISVGTDEIPTSDYGLSAGVYVANGSSIVNTPNQVINNGMVKTYGSNTNSIAVYSTGGYTAVLNTGTMWGDVLLNNGGGTGCFTNTGTFMAGNAVTVGACGMVNSGTIEGGRVEGVASDLTITGDYRGTGRLVLDADFATGEADRLVVEGDAEIGDTIVIRPSVMRQGVAEIARAEGTLSLGGTAKAAPAALFAYDLAAKDGSLEAAPRATFVETSAGFGDNRQAVAQHLQALWDGGVRFDDGFTELASVEATDVPETLDALSGQALGLIGATRYQASLGFVDSIWSGCDATPDGRCAWGGWTGTRSTMDTSSDAKGYETRSNGFRLGYGGALLETTTIGFAVGYENLSADDRDGLGSVDGDSAQIAAYGTWEQGPWRFGAAAELGYGWFDTSRTIALAGLSDEATGSTNAWQAGLHGRAAWHRNFTQGWIEPRLDLSLIHVATSAFTEAGSSPFNLAVDSASDTVLVATPAIAGGAEFGLKDGSRLTVFGSMGYALMSDDAWSPTAHLADGTEGFSSATPLPDRLWKLGLGAELVTVGKITLSASYHGDLGQDYSSHAAVLRLDYRF
ncbi:hypothetical protein [Sphingomonas sp.]|uniref:hypothetical protein n=1 Tax=Sphingomonas sp. TaxID=28214 RepID=UPI002DD6453A|nr:hypothetical protein [Sphingomonas sp.]